jgi:iron complex outermembrane receptor protein
MKQALLLTGISIIFYTTIGCIPAYAQSIDYGSLETLFGEPITTSATGTPQRASEVAANMTIITADQIRQAGTRDIPVIIGIYVPGVDVLQEANGSYDVGVRGFQQVFQPRLLVLIDGRQVFVDDYSRTIWSNLPVNIDDIRQIEVVKGPASALFGSNAASGVINIVTYSPDHDKNNVATVGLGTQDEITADATMTENGQWGGVKISAGGLNANEFNTPRAVDDNAELTEPFKRYAASSGVFQLAPGLQANGEATYSESHENIVPIASFTMQPEDTTSYSARGGLAWNSPYGVISNDNYLNHTNSIIGTVPLVTNLIVSNLNDQFKLGDDNTFRATLEYRHKNFSEGGPFYNEDVYSAGGTWLWQISDNLSWTNSARVDHQDGSSTTPLNTLSLFSVSGFEHSLNVFSANSAVNYKLTDDDTFHLSYGRGVQIPGLLAAGSDLVINSVVLFTGNPDLKPTITQNYEFGYDRQIAPISSTVKFATFYTVSQDISILVNRGTVNGIPLVFEPENFGNSTSYGGEISLDGHSSNGFRWNESYSFARVTDSQSVLNNVDYQGSYPQHQIKLDGGYTYDKWEFDANGQYSSSTDMLRGVLPGGESAPVPIDTAGYYSLGGRIGYKLSDQFTAALSGTNITRHLTDASPYPAIERQALFSLTGRF